VSEAAANDPSGEALAQALRVALATHRDAVLQAPPGAGKSTRVPLALLAEPWLAGRKLLLLEPRRVAARAVATRMAELLGEPVGQTVGYRMRMDTRVSHATRIEVITEGVLTRMLQSDPELAGVGAVIFDEFHERSLQADLAFALANDARRQLDAGYRMIAMSATLEGARVAALLDDAPVVDVPGRAFPVELRYTGSGLPLLPGGREPPERLVVQVIRRALAGSTGDLLVFLPGAGEIRRVRGMLADLAGPQLELLMLFGDLPGAEQDAVLRGHRPDRRRIVLATNIAETSVTIPGVTVVIDGGLARRSRFDPLTGMSRLEVMRIARSSADQRAGRAGRTAPGVCYRLWSEGAHASLAAHTPAEILEADLAPLALELAQWGSGDATQLAWLDPPPAPMLAQARGLLARLGALDAQGRITAQGKAMSALPLHPRLAHMLGAARGRRARQLAAELAALISERDLLRGAGRERDPDIRSRLELLHHEASAEGLDRGMLERVRRTAAQLERSASEAGEGSGAGARSAGDEFTGPGELLALAFPDRIAQRREGAGGRYLLANGRGAAFPAAHALGNQEYLVAVELDDREREARIDLAAPISRAELEAAMSGELQREESVAWDARTGAVLARRLLRYGSLVLEDKPLPKVPAEAAGAAMLQGILQLGIAALPWDESARNLQARLEFVRALGRSDLAGWPASDDASLLATAGDWLPAWLEGCTRREHLARLPLAEMLLARLTSAQRRALDELAPRELAMPTGSRLRIDYVDDNAPCLSVRLQEVFGMAATPRIGGGAVPVTFKLLSPAQRPLQITRDLAGFWRSSYLEVRKEMRGRYPRHNWPENPAAATPHRGVKRRG
jgi:ATP-dependent helicase HrpB